jgi:WD40 repeat protein
MTTNWRFASIQPSIHCLLAWRFGTMYVALQVFDMGSGKAEPVGTVSGLERGVFTLDFSPDDKRIAVAGGDTAIRVLTIEEKAGIMTPRDDDESGESKTAAGAGEASPAVDDIAADAAPVAEEKDGVLANETKQGGAAE